MTFLKLKIRSVKCLYFDKPVDDKKCADTKPEDKANCNLKSCPAYVYSKWSPCSVSCGAGQKTRTATCNLGNDKCNSIKKDQTIVACKKTECPIKRKFFWI